MGRWVVLVAIVLVTAGMAGCLGGGDVEPEDSGSETSPQSTNDSFSSGADTTDTTSGAEDTLNVSVEWFNGTVQGQAIPTIGPTAIAPISENVFDFDVPNATTAIYAELAWNRSVSLSLDLDHAADSCDGDCPPDSQSGQSPVIVEVTDESVLTEGGWSASVFAEDSPVMQTEFMIAISQFENDAIPSDYGRLS